MATKQEIPIHRFLRKVVDQHRDDLSSDQDLLRRFAARRDEDAFATLVRRHGAMVLGVAMRVLHQHQDAEDVCQATFLLLAKKAGAVPWRDSVANWLYGGAYRLALQARDAAKRRHTREAKVKPKSPPDAMAEITLRDLQAILDEELSCLPKKFSTPIVLCCLEGKARDEAAQYLGWPLATVKSRLEAGRELLRGRLARRGLALSAVLGGVTLTSGIVRAALPAGLALATSRAALQVLTGQTAAGVVYANVMVLIKKGAPIMLLTKLKIGMALLLVGVLTSGVATLAEKEPAQAQGENAPQLQVKNLGDSDGKKQDRLDRHGDPLPAGALSRLGTVRFRHGQQIESLALSPDGKTLATGGYPGRVCLWEAGTGRLLATLRGPAGHVFALRFSPDGATLAVGGSTDASLTGAGETVLFNVSDRTSRLTLRHARSARCLAFTPDGATLVVGCEADEVSAWNTVTGKDGPRLPGAFTLGATAAAFSPDGSTLATGGADKLVRLWDWPAAREAGRLDVGSAVRALAFAKDGKTLLTGQDGPRTVLLWDVEERKVLREFSGHKAWDGGRFPGSAYTVAFAPDGRTVASGGDDGAVLLWDSDTAKLRVRHQNPSGSVHGLAFAPDGKTLMTGSTLGRVQLFDVSKGKELQPFDEHTAGLADMALSRDGKTLATAGADRTIRLWDLKTASTIRVLSGHRKGVYSVQFSPDGRTLVSGGGDGTVRLWEVATGEDRQVTDAQGWNSRAAFSADGGLIASAGADSKIRLWNAATGKEVGRLEGHSGYIVGLVFSPDGKWLATTGESYVGQAGPVEDNTVRLWDVAKRAEHRVFTRGHIYSGPLRFSPDGRTFVYSDGGTLHFADVATGKEFRPSPYTGVQEFTFAAGGRWLVTAGADRTVRLWELATGLELHRIGPLDCAVSGLAVGPGDRTLLTLNSDGTVLVWDLTPPGLRREGAQPYDFDGDWTDLLGGDGPKAYRAAWGMASGSARSVPALRKRLPESLAKVRAEGPRIRALIADLDSDTFEKREAASKHLAALGEDAEPAMRMAWAGRPSLEARRRLELLLAKAEGLRSGEVLRVIRALGVLEQIGSPPARQVLEEMAQGAADDWVTEDARASLDRLAKRAATTP